MYDFSKLAASHIQFTEDWKGNNPMPVFPISPKTDAPRLGIKTDVKRASIDRTLIFFQFPVIILL